MPLPTSALTKQSGKDVVRKAISDCISQSISEGRERRQAIAMCLNDARQHAGARFVPRRVRLKGK